MATPVQDIGPTVVYTPGTGQQHLVDIVFVHGLFGHPKNTWTARTPRKSQNQGSIADSNEIFWPRDLLPTRILTARIITWGYDVRIESLRTQTSKATISQHAETLLEDLARLRLSQSGLPIIFVAHSLGGIVVKDALSISKQEETTHLKDILPATVGVAFLGTPHRGSKTASLGKIAFELSKLFFQNPNIKILRALEKQSEIFDHISRSFAQILASNGDIKVHSFQEEFDTMGMTIVDATSSTIEYGPKTRGRTLFYANHSNMTKYSNAGDINFQRVSSVLERWVEPPSATMNNSDKDPTDISDEAYQSLLDKLDFPDARSRIQNVKRPYEGTYNWLYDDKLGFKEWLQGHDLRPIFWISGKPGSGKSTLMKFALTQGATRDYLTEYSQCGWLLIGHFFHDRGSEVQKSNVGFLCELLYQMLKQRRELFVFIQPILQDWDRQRDLKSPAFYDIEILQRALFAIVLHSDHPLNCCLLVDAMDEHHGNHRDLVLFLKDLASRQSNPHLRLRLVLASRPENIFLNTLDIFPGFAIHEYTHTDIRRYAESRFRDEQPISSGEQQGEITRRLVSQIVDKSDGVFMWVRLVVDELIKGLGEGDTPGELEELLLEVPTELSDLYVRAIRRRPRRSTTRSVAKHRAQAYIMFRIVSSALEPIPLEHVVRASLFLTGEKQSIAEVDTMSAASMQRRLNSRSCGLLEAIVPADSNHGSGKVCNSFTRQ